MNKKAILILFLLVSFTQFLNAEEKFLSLKKIRQMSDMDLVLIIQLNIFIERLTYL